MNDVFELCRRAVLVRDQRTADRWFAKLVAALMVQGRTREAAESLARMNLGYTAGYYSRETRRRVERFYKAEHPFLGSVADMEHMTPMDIFAQGEALGKMLKDIPATGFAAGGLEHVLTMMSQLRKRETSFAE